MPKPKCTKELINDAVKLKKTGMNNQDMCACLGISTTAFYRWINTPTSPRHIELRDALKKTEGEFKTALRGRIIGKSKDDWKAAAWMLERMYPEEFAKPEVQLARKIAKATIDQADDELTKSLKELANSL